MTRAFHSLLFLIALKDDRHPYASAGRDQGMKIFTPIFLIAACALLIGGCSKESDKSKSARDPKWERGRAVYLANCVACHNADPSKDGPIGPAIKGSSQELIQTRVLRTEYPAGYKPKRNTKLMPTFPFLKSEVPYLAIYLRQ
jgi:mono/diheme cytochrome c family protein